MTKNNDFERIAAEIAKLVSEKNIAYGNSFGKSANLIKDLYPNGVSVDQYDDFLCVIRVIDKLFRIATRKKAFGESPWRDIVGYGILAISVEEKSKKKS